MNIFLKCLFLLNTFIIVFNSVKCQVVFPGRTNEAEVNYKRQQNGVTNNFVSVTQYNRIGVDNEQEDNYSGYSRDSNNNYNNNNNNRKSNRNDNYSSNEDNDQGRTTSYNSEYRPAAQGYNNNGRSDSNINNNNKRFNQNEDNDQGEDRTNGQRYNSNQKSNRNGSNGHDTSREDNDDRRRGSEERPSHKHNDNRKSNRNGSYENNSSNEETDEKIIITIASNSEDGPSNQRNINSNNNRKTNVSIIKNDAPNSSKKNDEKIIITIATNSEEKPTNQRNNGNRQSNSNNNKSSFTNSNNNNNNNSKKNNLNSNFNNNNKNNKNSPNFNGETEEKVTATISTSASSTVVTVETKSNLRLCEKKYVEYIQRIFPQDLETAQDANDTELNGRVLASPGEYPHMTALGFPSEGGGVDYKCGGSLISEYFVITAAHCTNFAGQAPTTVRIGDLNLMIEESYLEPQIRNIRNIYAHPDYKSTSYYNDIGLLELDQEVRLTEFVRPIRLWSKPKLQFKTAYAMGYGATDFARERTNRLTDLNMTIIENDECNRELPKMPETDRGILPSQICARDFALNRDTCQGDSGGPLQLNIRGKRRKNRLHYQLIGITSFGLFCRSGYPSIYTRVYSYLDWIERIVWRENF